MAYNMHAEKLAEWEASPEGKEYYAAHPDEPNMQTIRMQVAFARRGGAAAAADRNQVDGCVSNSLCTLIIDSTSPANPAAYLMSLLSEAELHDVMGRHMGYRRTPSQVATITAAVRSHINQSRYKGVTLAQKKAPYWSPQEYKEWCASDEGAMFYWLSRHHKEGGPSEFMGDDDTPETMQAAIASLREQFAASEEKSGFATQLFHFLQRHEPHRPDLLYPQTFLYAVSLLKPRELSLAKSAIKGSFDAPNQHPNAITLRHIHSAEATAANAEAWPSSASAATTTDTSSSSTPKRKLEEKEEEAADDKDNEDSTSKRSKA